jgi:eukaryotic-like serine/threonine-protein kinase
MSPRLPCPPEHWPAFSRRLDEALALPEAARAAWLAALPAPDHALAQWLAPVLQRLQAGEADTPALQSPRLPGPPPAPGDAWTAGRRVGPYELLAPLGQGGMGTVWRARRADGAYARELALKLPHPHLLAGAVRERFARERDILASLVHPHIAAFYDAGLDDSGQPYLALECVPGELLTAHAQRGPLGLPERLDLFAQVLSAVAYAHDRLVAHRDLKPANVLVTAQGQVKLLDFGIARLLAPGGDDPALTRETLLATPRYAAPEQRSGGVVTAATDVYALGMMLHELLTGALPPPAGAATGVAAAGSAGPGAEAPLPSACATAVPWRRALRGDLDAIVHKALQADPGARYAGAAAMAEDLRRHRRGEPIAARRITAAVRARKFVRRHRLPVALAAGLALSLLLGAAGVAWQSQQALAQAQRAQAVKDFLVSVFEGADPRLAGNRPRGATPVRELLDRHAQRIDTEFAGQPLLRAELLRLVAELYRELDEPAAAQAWRSRFETLATRELGPQHPWVLGSRVDGLQQAYTVGELARCRELATPLGQDILRAGLGGDEIRARWWTHLSLCHSDQPGHEAERLRWLHDAQALLARVAPGGRAHVTVWAEIGSLLSPTGRYEDALQAYRQALVLAEALPRRNEAELQTLHGNIGLALQQMGRLDEAAQAYARAAEVAERTVGAAHPTSWDPRVNHLRTLHLAGQRDAAWALLPALEAATQAAGERPDVLVNLANLREHVGERLAAEGRAGEALPWLRSAAELQSRVAVYPFAHRRALRNLGDALDRAGAHDEAGRVLADALQRYEAADRPGRQPVLAARERWARWLLDRGRLAEAQQQFQRTVADAETPTWAHVALAQAGLARVALAQGDPAQASRHSARALATWAAVTGFRDVRMQAYLWRVRAATLERSPDAWISASPPKKKPSARRCASGWRPTCRKTSPTRCAMRCACPATTCSAGPHPGRQGLAGLPAGHAVRRPGLERRCRSTCSKKNARWPARRAWCLSAR